RDKHGANGKAPRLAMGALSLFLQYTHPHQCASGKKCEFSKWCRGAAEQSLRPTGTSYSPSLAVIGHTSQMRTTPFFVLSAAASVLPSGASATGQSPAGSKGPLRLVK